MVCVIFSSFFFSCINGLLGFAEQDFDPRPALCNLALLGCNLEDGKARGKRKGARSPCTGRPAALPTPQLAITQAAFCIPEKSSITKCSKNPYEAAGYPAWSWLEALISLLGLESRRTGMDKAAP